jgi:hypothetical protein
MALFSKLFVAYDFYGFVGLGLAMTKNQGAGAGDFGVKEGNDIDAANEGFRLGGAFGLGMHVFFTDFFSMGVELRDIVFADNEPGADITRGLKDDEIAAKGILINGDDKKISNHIFVGLNFTVFFPIGIQISR